MNVSTAFEFLQLEHTATLSDVNLSYRKLLMEYHPDRNVHRSEWSHQMTIRLTEAYTAVSIYLSTIQNTKPPSQVPEESDSGYSLTIQSRIGCLYDDLLDHIGQYFTQGMNKLYLVQEGTLRHRYRLTLKKLNQTIKELELTLQWPGSALQHSQVRAILDFSAAFYENMLIKPKSEQIYTSSEAKARRYYNNGSQALDEAVQHGILELKNESGIISPATRHIAEKNFLYLLTNFPKSVYVPETLIKLYLLKAFSALCEHLEKSLP